MNDNRAVSDSCWRLLLRIVSWDGIEAVFYVYSCLYNTFFSFETASVHSVGVVWPFFTRLAAVGLEPGCRLLRSWLPAYPSSQSVKVAPSLFMSGFLTLVFEVLHSNQFLSWMLSTVSSLRGIACVGINSHNSMFKLGRLLSLLYLNPYFTMRMYIVISKWLYHRHGVQPRHFVSLQNSSRIQAFAGHGLANRMRCWLYQDLPHTFSPHHAVVPESVGLQPRRFACASSRRMITA